MTENTINGNLSLSEQCSYTLLNDVPDEVLNMKLVDLLCKHVFNTCGSKGKNESSYRLLTASLEVGYKWCLWGAHSGHALDFDYHMNKIVKMEEDGYEHALRIVKCNYDYSNGLYYWCDNIHSSIMYLRKYGLNVRLRDVPFYIIDITETKPLVLSYKDSVRKSDKDINGAILCAYKRKERSDSKEILDIGYTLGDFINENFGFYTYKRQDKETRKEV